MGRPRGKGKKAIDTASNEDPGSGVEEVIPTYKRRGRPQKLLKDDMDYEDDLIKIEDGDDVKTDMAGSENKSSVEIGKKRRRRRNAQMKPSSVSAAMDANGSGLHSDHHESVKSNGFRHIGSRRKSTPRRAAEAGVECT